MYKRNFAQMRSTEKLDKTHFGSFLAISFFPIRLSSNLFIPNIDENERTDDSVFRVIFVYNWQLFSIPRKIVEKNKTLLTTRRDGKIYYTRK